MARPYQHPKTGTYWLRKVVPENLRAAVGQRELKQTLGTKDPSEARVRTPAVLARFDAIIAAARADAPPQPSLRQIDTIVGKWYKAESARREDNPGSSVEWDDALSYYADMFSHEAGRPAEFIPEATFRKAAQSLLHHHGYAVDQETARLTARRWAEAQIELARVMLGRLEGIWTPDPNLGRFPLPRSTPSTPAPAALVLSLRDMFTGWEAATPSKPRTIREAHYAIEALIAFLGHDDAARVDPADLIRYRNTQRDAGLVANTWNNRLSMISQVFAHSRTL